MYYLAFSLPYQNEIFIQCLATATYNGMRGLFKRINVNFRAYVRLHVLNRTRHRKAQKKERET